MSKWLRSLLRNAGSFAVGLFHFFFDAEPRPIGKAMPLDYHGVMWLYD